MKINKFGLKMRGLKTAAGESKCLRGHYDPRYIQISYNRATGDVITDEHYDLGHSWQTFYNNADIINIGNMCSPHTMQRIADRIAWEMYERDEISRETLKNGGYWTRNDY